MIGEDCNSNEGKGQMPDTSDRLGKYEILSEIGKGGFATVYRAHDPDLGRDIALKVLDPLLTRDPVWVARFRHEARAVAGLDHPRIVTVHEVNQDEGRLFIAMKLLEGGSLADRIKAGPLPWAEVVRLTGEIAEALDYAHGRGVLHRDLKPANVLLDAHGHAVLTDFGFARLVADNSLSVSVSGGIVGTPAYVAPEVWEGKPGAPQTDVYALGCILYEMATGAAPVQGRHPARGDARPLPAVGAAQQVARGRAGGPDRGLASRAGAEPGGAHRPRRRAGRGRRGPGRRSAGRAFRDAAGGGDRAGLAAGGRAGRRNPGAAAGLPGRRGAGAGGARRAGAGRAAQGGGDLARCG